EAVFSIDWHDDGSVSGTYHYPQRPGVTYTLRGSNPREGELFLEEYTGRELTARCLLRKRVEGGIIEWQGTMTNTDGRRLPMSFARAREQAPAPVPADGYEAKRREILAGIEPLVVWESFPLADRPVDFVPVDVDDGEYFEAKVEGFRVTPGAAELTLL